MSRIVAKLLSFLLVAQAAVAFAPRPAGSRPSVVQLEATQKPMTEKVSQIMTTAAVALATSPLMAIAEEADDYEYGAVNAPIGIAWAAGVLAVGTALLPLALQGGEDAFNEMREKDADVWGTGKTNNKLKKRF